MLFTYLCDAWNLLRWLIIIEFLMLQRDSCLAALHSWCCLSIKQRAVQGAKLRDFASVLSFILLKVVFVRLSKCCFGLLLQKHMQSFMEYIVNIMKRNKFFASQGGPIILAQVSSPLMNIISYGIFGPKEISDKPKERSLCNLRHTHEQRVFFSCRAKL